MDNPLLDDNREYDYSASQLNVRDEYYHILNLVPRGASVIDFGCGNGFLLKLLQEKNGCRGLGIDTSATGVEVAKRLGVSAKLGRADEVHPELKNDEFDFSICNVTIQMVSRPEILLQEMTRVSRKQIITFPNFAFYKNRIDLLWNGRMPKPLLYGYQWWSTGHIHQLSMKDFESFVGAFGLRIDSWVPVKPPKNVLKRYLCHAWPNLFCIEPLYVLEKSSA